MDILDELETEINNTLERINTELNKYIEVDNENETLFIIADKEEVISDKLIQYYSYLGQKLAFESMLDYVEHYRENMKINNNKELNPNQKDCMKCEKQVLVSKDEYTKLLYILYGVKTDLVNNIHDIAVDTDGKLSNIISIIEDIIEREC